MSKRLPIHVPADAPDQPPIWRSLGEKADPTRRAKQAVEEPAVQVPEKSILGRRSFLAVTGATGAAVTLSGCLRRPAENILPYSHAPEHIVPGVPLHFATAVQHHGDAVGLLVETHEGRPTKVEGNPDHPGSLGKTDAQLQATILELYDPARPAFPSTKGDAEARTSSTWPDFEAMWREKAASLGSGRGLAVLMQPTSSPSYIRAREALLRRFPDARVHTWSPVAYTSVREGARLAFGQPLSTVVDYARARRVLAVDCDFLGAEPGSIRNQRRWAEARKLAGPQEDTGRLYAVEGTLSVTGMSADHRLRLPPSRAGAYLRALGAMLARNESVTMPAGLRAALREDTEVPDGVPSQWLAPVADDLASHRGQAVVVVGSGQPAHVHALAHAINAALGAVGAAVAYFPPADLAEPDHVASLRELTDAMREGQVSTLVVLGGNPVYDAPADLRFAEALERVQTSIALSALLDETSSRCTWHLPLAHAFESWGDHRSLEGLVSIQQPLIAPLRRGRAEHEVLALLAGVRGWRGYSQVRATVREMVGASPQLERIWRQSLHRGIVLGGARPTPLNPALREAEIAAALSEAAQPAAEGWEVVFRPSYQTHDGRFATAAWLLEMPEPITKVAWDNAAWMSPASARELGIPVREGGYAHGALVTLAREGASEVTLPAFVVPGHADRVVTLPLGWGRTHAGEHGTGAGFDVYPFRTSDALGFATGVRPSLAGGSYVLAQTQEHHSMEGRPLVIDATLEQYRETPDFAQWRAPTPALGPLWTQVDYSAPRPPAQGGTTYSLYPEPRLPRPGAPPRYKWGMVVDLTTCTGCSACVVACQAENNSPIVGKRQVALGREMHWMRVDRYFVGDDVNDPQVGIQPMLCQHCEEAPCENVCPVNATAHSPEGINEMAYNRCIGTRYCMNNCPYKVRRFNYLDWHGDLAELERMQFNPNVTVRMRGVMEKCTFCVQRIQAARIRARQDTVVGPDGEIRHAATAQDVRARRARRIGELIEGERQVRAEEVTPACAQACPSDAIVFGDLNDTESAAHRLAHLDRQYKVLASIGTQPRVTYLGKIRNPNPEMV